MIENLGYVVEYLDLYEDLIAHFKEVTRKRKEEMKKWESKNEIFLNSVYVDELMDENENAMRHLGVFAIRLNLS